MKFGTALSRFAGGVAGAAASLAGKYIDDDLARQRAEFLAELQRESSLRTERELDAQRNTPERLERDRENRRQDTLAAAAAQREGVAAGVNDPAYQSALDQGSLFDTRRRIKVENDFTEGTKGAKLAAEQERMKGLLPFEKQKAQALADIQVGASKAIADAAEKRHASANSFGAKLKAIEDFIGRDLSDDERLSLVGIQKKGGDDGLNKLAMEAASKALEAQQIKPEEVGQYANRVLNGFQAVRVGAQVAIGVAAARKDGNVEKAVSELQNAGLSLEQIAPYLTEAERKRFGAQQGQEPSVGGFFNHLFNSDKAAPTGKADSAQRGGPGHMLSGGIFDPRTTVSRPQAARETTAAFGKWWAEDANKPWMDLLGR